MTGISSDSVIEVSLLKVGMYIHLDLGWWAHPFSLSSFKLKSEEQIAQLRELKLEKVRWSPSKSDLQADAEPIPDLATVAATAAAAIAAAAQVSSPEGAARQAHRDALKTQREALSLCEEQYAEASTSYRELMDLVPHQPAASRDRAQALTVALLDKMLGDTDLNIRLLGEGAGDRNTAHALNVSIISLLLARAFKMPADEMLDLGLGAMLHDIGKLELPARVRSRDDSLAHPELQLYQSHVEKGVALGQRMGLNPGPLQVIAQHHENADGTGFPERLNADRMSAAARIVSLVNRFDGLCNPTIPAKALTPHEALSLMFAQGRSQFDGAMLNAFIRMMGVYPPGSAVQLTDDRFALVVAVNSSRPLKPRVMVHDPKVPPDEALVLNLEHQSHLGVRRSLKPSMLPLEVQSYLSPRKRVAYFFEPMTARPETYQELAA